MTVQRVIPDYLSIIYLWKIPLVRGGATLPVRYLLPHEFELRFRKYILAQRVAFDRLTGLTEQSHHLVRGQRRRDKRV